MKQVFPIPYFFIFHKDDNEENERSVITLMNKYLGKIPENSSIQIKPLVEGLTNQLFKVTIKTESKSNSYVIRIYGHDSSVLVDREREVYVLSTVDPDLLKLRFENGIILRFEEGDSLISKQLVSHQEGIAKQMAKLHKRPLFRSLRGSSPKNEFFEEIDSWFLAAKSKDPNWELSLTCGKKINLAYIEEELAFIKNIIYSSGYSMVCSHNDINAENCIFDASFNNGEGGIKFIDYEYAMNNVRGFDIGNHFCEYAGVSTHFNFADCFPTKETQLPFLSYYLNEFSGSQPTNEEIEILYLEVNRCVMLSHFFWGLWGVVQKYISDIDFDFDFYSRARYDEYNKGRTAYPDDLQYK